MTAHQQQGLAVLSPANFGMIMATGIVSLAAHFVRIEPVSNALFHLNNGLYALLCLLTFCRMLRYHGLFLNDLFSHTRGPGFFTFVAGTSVLGTQHIVIAGHYGSGLALWSLALLSWLLLTYSIFFVLIIKKEKPALDQSISGVWLLTVVATQSIAVLSILLAAKDGQPHRLELNVLALSMWLFGGMLYIWIIALIFYRYLFFRQTPADLAPPSWINMGAMAISTLAGALLIENATDAALLSSLLPFLKGITLLYWSTATWWIPLLLMLGVWRYGYQRIPLRYDPLYWAVVFPLGMYSACTARLATAMDFTFMGGLPTLIFSVALLAWLATFWGMLRRAYRSAGYLVEGLHS